MKVGHAKQRLMRVLEYDIFSDHKPFFPIYLKKGQSCSVWIGADQRLFGEIVRLNIG